MSIFVGLLIGDNPPSANIDRLDLCLGFETTGAADILTALWSKETRMRVSSRQAAAMAAVFVSSVRSAHKNLSKAKCDSVSGPSAPASYGRIGRAAMTIVFAICAGTIGPAHDARAELVSAVEFWHAGFNHYFLTTNLDEMVALDTGKFGGWTRFLPEFKVNAEPGPDLVPVCRFFSAAFAPKSSHFFTAFPEECAAVKANPVWTYEGIAFYARLPAANGACAPGTMAIYRSYNGGEGGAPAHRYTPYLGDSCYPYNFFGPACVREGVGADGVAFCVPVSIDIALQRTQQMSGGTWDFRYTLNGVPTLVSMSFGAAVSGSQQELPPQWLGPSYYVLPLTGRGGAGWDAIMGRMDVGYVSGVAEYDYTRFVFDFDGVNATNGCMYTAKVFEYVLGPCHPLTAVRRFP